MSELKDKNVNDEYTEDNITYVITYKSEDGYTITMQPKES
jgi:hypothetical protein